MSELAPISALELSPFLKRLVSNRPEWLEQLQESGRLHRHAPPEAADLAKWTREHGLDVGLRLFRNREMLRLIWRDIEGLAPVDEILLDLSTLAELCLSSAVEWHSRALKERYGTPRDDEGLPQQMVVIGMGKLGGHELNLSSDIDIVFCYPRKGICTGNRGLANEQFFTRLARSVIRTLSEVTEDGFCYRVDTRLRPFGESGPLVNSFAALEHYYQREGRDWERYALIKARPVAGDIAAGSQLLEILRPFIYRRYIDFGAIEALRDMHASVREDTRKKSRQDDIKRGPGGIREIEFLVQAFQLLRGGRERQLQTPSIVAAVNGLSELRLLPVETAERLLLAYRFLRKVENRIQALHDQQTHVVPTGEDGKRVALAMGFSNQDDFLAELTEVRHDVQTLFEDSFPQPVTGGDDRNPWYSRWQQLRNNIQQDESSLDERGPLADFIKRLNRLSLSQRASQRLDQFMPYLLQRVDELGCRDEVIYRVLDLVSAICQRSAYLSLLVQNPQASNRMLELFSLSGYIARAVTRYPALLDELIDPSLGAAAPDRSGIQAGIDQILAGFTDTETTLQELNYFKRVILLRIAVAVLQSVMSATRATSILGQLAQAMVQAILGLARSDMQARHGRLPGPELGVIAYGSLGAEAPGFGSDLDLIFLYLPTRSPSDGKRPIHAERYHTSVARRMLSLLSASTPAGRLYAIDARLRPNGRAGLLVSSLDSFSNYQSDEAWTWELQALTRARPIAGNKTVCETFDKIRHSVLTGTRDINHLETEIQAMRKRIQNEHGAGDQIKYSPGGLLDIEFMTQMGLLINAPHYPELLESTRLDAQLIGLRDCGWLSEKALQTLQTGYVQLSELRLQLTLLDQQDTDSQIRSLDTARTLCDSILRSL